jgi:hypothetical protein
MLIAMAIAYFIPIIKWLIPIHEITGTNHFLCAFAPSVSALK